MKPKVIRTLKLSLNKESLANKTSKNEVSKNSSCGKNLTRKQNLNVFLPLIILVLLTTISFLALSSPNSSAEDNLAANIGVNVASSCTFSGVVGSAHSASINAGLYTEDIGATTLTTICNDDNGYAIYAVGYTNNELGNNTLMHADGETAISTGTATSGDISNWAMKLTPVNNLTGESYAPTILNNYANYNLVPATYTKVASYAASTDADTGSQLKTTYAAYVALTQKIGTYAGQVKYAMVHPSTNNAPYYLQDLTATSIATLLPNVGDTAILADRRDLQLYTVGKLTDGNYWLLENLRLGTSELVEELSVANTNMSAEVGFALPGPAAKINSFTAPQINTRYSDDKYTYHRDGTETGMSGVFYNYCAATAGTYCYEEKRAGLSDAEYDICPYGWRMPTGGASGEYSALLASYRHNDVNFLSNFRLVAAGYLRNSSLRSPGYMSFAWSNTVYEDEDEDENAVYTVWTLGATNSINSVGTGQTGSRDTGYSVRCIFNN